MNTHMEIDCNQSHYNHLPVKELALSALVSNMQARGARNFKLRLI